MSGVADIVVLELAVSEPGKVTAALPRFTDALSRAGLTSIREWTPSTEAYVVLRDPKLRAFGVAESVSGLRIGRAARLEIPARLRLGPGGPGAHLPEELDQPITFPGPMNPEPRMGIRPPARPLVFCPYCRIRIHPGPVCAASQ
jgi:hypothetical protein